MPSACGDGQYDAGGVPATSDDLFSPPAAAERVGNGLTTPDRYDFILNLLRGVYKDIELIGKEVKRWQLGDKGRSKLESLKKKNS